MVDDNLVPESPLPSILNFRDVGQTVNRLRGSKLVLPWMLRNGEVYKAELSHRSVLQEGRLFRSARACRRTCSPTLSAADLSI